MLPTLIVPTLSAPGFAFAAAMKSPSVLNSESAPVAKMKSKNPRLEIGCEILEGIERQLLEQGDADRGAVGKQRQRVAVWWRRDHRSGRGDAAGAGLVLDVKTLPKLVAELFRNDARRDVGDAAGGKRQNDAHGLVGIAGLRIGRMRLPTG